MSSNIDGINNDLTPKLLKPEIIALLKRNNLSIFASTAFAFLACLILIGSFYYLLKPKDTKKSRLGTKIENELVERNFFFSSSKEVPQESLRNQELQDPVSFSNRHLNTKRETSKLKSTAFQKYKSIPTNDSSESSEVVTSDANKTEDNAIIAESINIDPNFLLPEGTYIPCSLTTRFVSSVAGHIQCIVSKDVYSASGNVKLIERGTKAIGVYQSGILQHGMARMFVIWSKLLTPDHKRINLSDTQVVGPLGEAGIAGRVDSHFLQRFGGALMVSIVKDVLQHAMGRNSKLPLGNTININSYDHTKDSFTSIAEKMLENSINIPPTMYKKQGDIVGILVGRDIDFSKIYQLQSSK